MFCNLKQRFTTVLALVLVSAIGSGQASQTNGPKQLRRAETFAIKDGPEISVEMESPAETDTRLQVLYFFEYREGEKNPDANQELDRKLRGVIQELRQSGKFAARSLETLTLVPPPYSIRPRQLLLIGLGKPEELSLDLIKSAGRVGMREALRLGVRQYAQTFDRRDDQRPVFGVGEIARSLIEGAISAYATEKELQERGLAEAQQMSRITLLTAPATYKETVQGVKNAISNLPQSASR